MIRCIIFLNLFLLIIDTNGGISSFCLQDEKIIYLLIYLYLINTNNLHQLSSIYTSKFLLQEFKTESITSSGAVVIIDAGYTA